MTAGQFPWPELERLLGREGVSTAGEAALARPADTEQTAAVVRWAGERGVRIAVGGGQREFRRQDPAGGTPAPLLRLDLGRMRRLRFYEPGDLTAGWDAGVTAAAVNQTLAAHQQFLPLDGGLGPATGGDDALGAICAAHRSGPLRHGYGTVRDFVIGIEAVTAAGQIVHGGGKVVKNVAGYDLMRLLIGSAGTLAVITGVHCKIFPALQTTETVRFALPGWDAAERLRTRLLHAPLQLIALELAGTGAADSQDVPLLALARFQGSAAVRARYQTELAAIGAELGLAATLLEAAEEAGLWAAWEQPPMPWRIGAPSGLAIELLRHTAALASAAGRRFRLRGRLALGVFGLALEAMPEGEERRAWNARWRAMAARLNPDHWLRDQEEPMAAAWGGAAADKSGGWMRRLRQHVDPAGVWTEARA